MKPLSMFSTSSNSPLVVVLAGLSYVDCISALYNSVVIELLRPLTTTPSHPSPHATLLEGAGLPIEPTLSYATLATRSQRTVYRFFDELYGQAQVVVLLEAFVVAVAFETLPTYDISADARLDFLVAFRIIYHSAKQFPILRPNGLWFSTLIS